MDMRDGKLTQENTLLCPKDITEYVGGRYLELADITLDKSRDDLTREKSPQLAGT